MNEITLEQSGIEAELFPDELSLYDWGSMHGIYIPKKDVKQLLEWLKEVLPNE